MLHWPWGVMRAPFPCSIERPWLRSSCPWGESRATSQWPADVQPVGQRFGDPMLEFKINVLGPPAQKNIPDLLRYEPGFSVNLLADLAFPIGEYDNDQPLNLGRTAGMGAWARPSSGSSARGCGPPHDPGIPARRVVFRKQRRLCRQTKKTDPMFQVDAHLTRDFTERFWGSLDAAWYYGGKSSINGVAGEKLNNLGVGLTLG